MAAITAIKIMFTLCQTFKVCQPWPQKKIHCFFFAFLFYLFPDWMILFKVFVFILVSEWTECQLQLLSQKRCVKPQKTTTVWFAQKNQYVKKPKWNEESGEPICFSIALWLNYRGAMRQVLDNRGFNVPA